MDLTCIERSFRLKKRAKKARRHVEMTRIDWLNKLEKETKKTLQLDAVDLALPSGPLLKVRVAGPPSLHHSDLVPGVYEGGFKLWEGAVDLARLLAEEAIEAATTAEEAEAAPSLSSAPPPVSLVPLDSHLPRWLPGAPRPPSLHGARVLELGCGAALPSLVAAKAATGRGGGTGKGKGKGGGGERRGPVSVTLCDFNAEVLRTCTAANVAANFPEESEGAGSAAEGCRGEKALFRFFAGDWSNLREALGAAGALPPPSPCSPFSSASPGFDLILAAEVTYSPESYVPLADAIADLLAPPPATSAALVAAKRHYFGVGGNVEGFVESVTRGGRLRVEKVAVVEGPLPRDVLLLTRVQ